VNVCYAALGTTIEIASNLAIVEIYVCRINFAYAGPEHSGTCFSSNEQLL